LFDFKYNSSCKRRKRESETERGEKRKEKERIGEDRRGEERRRKVENSRLDPGKVAVKSCRRPQGTMPNPNRKRKGKNGILKIWLKQKLIINSLEFSLCLHLLCSIIHKF
jgi:hypothetical protein